MTILPHYYIVISLHYFTKKILRGSLFGRKVEEKTNAIVWHDTKIEPFVDKFEHKQKRSLLKQLELNCCKYILILSRYFSTKRLNLIARGWENRKSDSVTFMLDAFLDSTSWTLRSTKRVGLLFFCFHTRLSNEKINITSESFTCVALEKMISWKTYWSSHYRFLQNLKRYSLIYPRLEAFSKKEKCFWQADS